MNQTACGNAAFYCPKGTKIPLPVEQGYYSLPSVLGYFTNEDSQEEKQLNQHSQSICPKGNYYLFY